MTLELRSRAAAAALERIHDADAAQAEHAAQRRSEGGYGICEDCGGEIEPERLRFLPDATRCVGCQSRTERGARRL